MSIKDMVKDKVVTFLFYQGGELWYTTECGFKFPVPISDTGTAAMNAQDKALLYMRWIRKEIDAQEKLVELLKASQNDDALIKEQASLPHSQSL